MGQDQEHRDSEQARMHPRHNSQNSAKKTAVLGHISRMANYRYPKIAMEGYVHGQRSKGRPKRRWIDGLKEDCALLSITIQNAGSTAQDRRTWRGLVKELPLLSLIHI